MEYFSTSTFHTTSGAKKSKALLGLSFLVSLLWLQAMIDSTLESYPLCVRLGEFEEQLGRFLSAFCSLILSIRTVHLLSLSPPHPTPLVSHFLNVSTFSRFLSHWTRWQFLLSAVSCGHVWSHSQHFGIHLLRGRNTQQNSGTLEKCKQTKTVFHEIRKKKCRNEVW